jgi:penicillin-binding protein 1A
MPEGMKVIAINRKTGMQANEGDGGTIMEAFKPGTGPADSYWVIGMDELGAGATGEQISPQANKAITQGAGGLY